ncbi:MAG: hypothetical protein PHH54_07325 [Candidatus Nanoarchaeia archaeon]|nr:hypothetical protein [Candidatus Nanoarchaeia archaeon]MDD5741766.1 hypothetical protein [Candidatus Nanoarchaeia archaeon]
MINTIIDTEQMELVYEGPQTGPYSCISDYFLNREKAGREKQEYVGRYFAFGCDEEGKENGQRFWSYFLGNKNRLEGVLTLIDHGFTNKKDHVSVWYKGKPSIKNSFLKDIGRIYKSKINDEIAEKKRKLEEEIAKLTSQNKK